jgi:hypothetical protein
MAEKVILAEQELDFNNGVHTRHEYLDFDKDTELTVSWDGTEWGVFPQDMGGPYIVGNAALIGAGDDTGEPFAIASISAELAGNDTGITQITAEDNTAISHTIAIYQAVAEEVGIIVTYHDGEEHTHTGLETVTFNRTDGGVETFTKGKVIDPVEVELNFSDGDMTVEAADRELIKSVVIKKPDTLIPENIAEGIDIAGIIGTLVAGGGCSNLCMATYTAGSSFIKSTVQLIAKEDLDAIGFGTATKSFVLFIGSNTKAGMYNYRFPRVILQTNYSVAYLTDSQSSYGIRMYIYKSSSTTTTTSWSTSNISMSYMSANKIEGAMFYNDSGLQYYGSATYPLYSDTYLIVAGVIS